MTELLFRDDAYLKTVTARVVAVQNGQVELDRTIFYPLGGGQPGDPGRRPVLGALARLHGGLARAHEDDAVHSRSVAEGSDGERLVDLRPDPLWRRDRWQEKVGRT